MLDTLFHQSLCKDFCIDFKNNSTVEILEYSSDKEKSEIIEVAKKRGIDLKNNKDLAGFKTIYALTNTPNRNKCRLPKEVVEKSLKTIIGKPINIDHIRKYVVGHYLDAYIKDDYVYGIGVLYKSNFDAEWDEAKNLFKSGKLTTSFEIWCPKEKRQYHNDGTYSLKEMIMAGGAVLFKSKPAFQEAKVLEIAKIHCDEYIEGLEYASEVIIAEDKKDIPSVQTVQTIKPDFVNFDLRCIKCKNSNWKLLEDKETSAKVQCLQCNSNYDLKFKKYEPTKIDKNFQSMWDVKIECPQCKKPIKFFIMSNETEKELTCGHCQIQFKFSVSSLAKREIENVSLIDSKETEGGKNMLIKKEDIELSQKKNPQSSKKITYQERKGLSDDDFAIVFTVKNKVTGEPRKIRMFPIHDEAHVRNALSRLGQVKVKQTLKKYGISVDTVMNKILKRAKELNMTDLIEKHKANEEVEVYKSGIKKVASLTISYQQKCKDMEKQVALYKENATKILERRNALKEFAEDLKDEELLDDLKYENATLKMQLVSATINGDKSKNKEDLEISSKSYDELKNEIKKGITSGAIKKLRGGN